MSYVSGIRIYKIVNLSLLTKIISFVKKYFRNVTEESFMYFV